MDLGAIHENETLLSAFWKKDLEASDFWCLVLKTKKTVVGFSLTLSKLGHVLIDNRSATKKMTFDLTELRG